MGASILCCDEGAAVYWRWSVYLIVNTSSLLTRATLVKFNNEFCTFPRASYIQI